MPLLILRQVFYSPRVLFSTDFNLVNSWYETRSILDIKTALLTFLFCYIRVFLLFSSAEWTKIKLQISINILLLAFDFSKPCLLMTQCSLDHFFFSVVSLSESKQAWHAWLHTECLMKATKVVFTSDKMKVARPLYGDSTLNLKTNGIKYRRAL